MPMTKKDYVLIAGVLNRMRRRAEREPMSVLVTTVIDEAGEELGEALNRAYPAFDADTFRAAVRKSDSQEG